jgi:enoyl-[acyl-carrier protein] reductase II
VTKSVFVRFSKSHFIELMFLLYPNIEEIMKIIVEEGVKIVLLRQEIKNMDSVFKENGITLVHVVSSTVFALKAQNAGIDAIVAEGFEGGHNGRDETTTLHSFRW